MYDLVVFDLDFTLWDAGGTWCDHTYPPYTKKHDYVYDANGSLIRLYDDVIEILQDLKNRDIKIAVASRTGSPPTARRLIELFEIGDYFDFEEIYPASKLTHFREIQKQSNIPYEKMLFFDDEYRNIEEVSRLKVKSVLINSGISCNLVLDNLFNS